MEDLKPLSEAREAVSTANQIHAIQHPTKSEHLQYYQQQMDRYTTFLSSNILANIQNSLA